jgi:hypothetical protein
MWSAKYYKVLIAGLPMFYSHQIYCWLIKKDFKPKIVKLRNAFSYFLNKPFLNYNNIIANWNILKTNSKVCKNSFRII